jgi:hypothetical protein
MFATLYLVKTSMETLASPAFNVYRLYTICDVPTVFLNLIFEAVLLGFRSLTDHTHWNEI